jgi:ABC-type sugar transport system, permease component
VVQTTRTTDRPYGRVFVQPGEIVTGKPLPVTGTEHRLSENRRLPLRRTGIIGHAFDQLWPPPGADLAAHAPVTLGIHQYLGAHVGDWGAVGAAAVLSCVPAAALLLLAQTYVSAGIAGGSTR